MTLLALVADLHVDPYGMGRDPETGLDRREIDMLRTVAWVARRAAAAGADVLICAGDYTESRSAAPAPRIARIAAALAEGPERQIHVRGNHDRAQGGDSIVAVLGRMPGWTGYDAPGFELVDGVAICCIPFIDRAWWRAQPGNAMKPDDVAFRELAEGYVAIATGLYLQAQDAGARAAILVGHQQLAGGRMTDKQQSFLGDVDLVVDPRALAAIGYRAITFGHVHRAQTVLDDPVCPVLFVGSPERVDFAEEREPKSFVLLDVPDGDGPVAIERIPTPARRFVTVTGDQWADEMALAATHPRDAIVRVVDLDPAIELAEVRRELEAIGAFDIAEIRRRPVSGPEVAGGLSESLTAEAATEEYFAGDPDREALVELGRGILAEVSA